MALIALRSDAERAGAVDFLGLSSPVTNREDEDRIVAKILGTAPRNKLETSIIARALVVS